MKKNTQLNLKLYNQIIRKRLKIIKLTKIFRMVIRKKYKKNQELIKKISASGFKQFNL